MAVRGRIAWAEHDSHRKSMAVGTVRHIRSRRETGMDIRVSANGTMKQIYHEMGQMGAV